MTLLTKTVKVKVQPEPQIIETEIEVQFEADELTDEEILREVECRCLDVSEYDRISEFGDSEILYELAERNLANILTEEQVKILTVIWMNRRLGKDYQKLLDEFIYQILGKVI